MENGFVFLAAKNINKIKIPKCESSLVCETNIFN